MPDRNSTAPSFTLLYLKSVAVDYYEQLDEKKLLDYMNRAQKRKSIVDRMSQVELIVAEQALILSKPLWWSSTGDTQLPYTQLREAYVFGKDNKRIAIDIMSIDSGSRRVLLFKARNLNEREELIELLQKRKMAKEMYEKDNIHPVEYANWSSTYADDAGKQPLSQPLSRLSVSSEGSLDSSAVVMKRTQGLSREIYDPDFDDIIHDDSKNKQLAIAPIVQNAIVEKPMREVTIQAGWSEDRSNVINPYYTPSPMDRWHAGDDWRRYPPQCPHAHGGECHQHNSIHIVIQGQTQDNPQQSKNVPMATVCTSSSPNGRDSRQQEVRINPIVEVHHTPTSSKPQTPQDQYSSTGILNRGHSNYHGSLSRNDLATPEAHWDGKHTDMPRYPSQMDMRSVENTNLKSRTYSQPDLSMKRSVNWDREEYAHSANNANHTMNPTNYRVIETRTPDTYTTNATDTGNHTFHSTYVTKTSKPSVIQIRDLSVGANSGTTQFRDECIEERITSTTYHTSKSPQTNQLVRHPVLTVSDQLNDAHHGWAKETKFYEIRNNQLAKVDRNGSRYSTVCMQSAL